MISRSDIATALKKSGVVKGSTVFCHSNLAFFGPVNNCYTMNDLVEVFLSEFTKALGPEGTLIVPAFTYSFGSDKSEKIFDPNLPVIGMSSIGNQLVKFGTGIRSTDPMLSVVGIGGKAHSLVENVGNVCFGPHSIWERLFEEDALICNLNFDSGSTFLHWLEREIGVSYRKDVELSGKVVIDNIHYDRKVIYTGRCLDDKGSKPKFETFHSMCIDEGVTTKINMGRGQICSYSCQDASKFLKKIIKPFPFILTQGNACNTD